ncbi:MAG TPA: hypothetical protein VFC19_01150 [Candidatus Limnocylindrales bacterium]|nr:hypothetical protein [Candidatus Limnocylindrales bacterium]
MAFDAERYRREVLDPARAAGNRPTDDLMLRYQLPSALDSERVKRAVAEVTAHWRQQRGKLAYRDVIQRLETDHHELAAVLAGPSHALRQKIDELRRKEDARSVEVAQELAGYSEATGMISSVMVDQLAARGYDKALVLRQAQSRGIEVRSPDTLPAESPSPAPQLASDLATLGCRHVADFLFGSRQSSVTVFGGHIKQQDMSRLDAIGREWAARAGNRKAAEGALAVLRRLSAEQVNQMLLYQCAEAVRARRDQHFGVADWLREAQGLGLPLPDAKRLVFAVRCEVARRGSPLARQLSELVGSGAMMSAARLVQGLADTEIPPDAAPLAAKAVHDAQRAAQLRERAARTADADAAWALLDESVALASDLPDVDNIRRGLPPKPPGRPAAAVGENQVSVGWGASASTTGPIAYRLLRARSPAQPGEVVAESPATVHADRNPPVNVPLHYSVIAYRGAAAGQPVAAAGPVWYLPDLSDLEAATSDGLVSASWRRRPEASGVLVRRSTRPPRDATDGDPVAVAEGATAFDDRDVASGTTYHYLLVTVYIGPDGQVRHSAGVRITATPARPPQPVRELAVEADPAEPGWLLVRFEPPEAGTVQLRELPEPPDDPAGTRMPVSALPGRKVMPSQQVANGIRCRPTPGSVVLLAVTVNGNAAVLGAHHEWVAVAAPTAMRYRRFGGRVVLTWEWPPEVSEIEVSWRIPGQRRHQESISAARYEAEGGAVVTPPRGTAVEISVAPVIQTGLRRSVGGGRTLLVQVPVHASYTIKLAGTRWNRRAVAVVTVTQPVRISRLVLLLAKGINMPLRVGDGEVLAELLDFVASPAVPVQLQAPLKGITRPFWLRCFAEGAEVELDDPRRERLYHRDARWRS